MISTIVFSTTDRCPIHCRFCGADCDPKNKNMLDYEWIAARIEQVESWGLLKQVIFTGGEPLMLGKKLFDLVRLCAEKQLLTRIVTNAYWAKTAKKARDVIGRLKSAGLTEINFSVDDFHQEFIPLANIRYAVDACAEVGLPVLLAHKSMNGCKITHQTIEKALDRKIPVFEETDREEKHQLVISSGWTVPIGKGSEEVSEEEWRHPDWKNRQGWKGACRSVLESLIFSCDKKLSICCGIILPQIREMYFDIEGDDVRSALAEANSDLLTNWLSIEGPYGIMKFIQKKDPSIPFYDHYVQNCHLCNHIFERPETRQVLKRHMDEYLPVIRAKRLAMELCRRRLARERMEACGEKVVKEPMA